MLCIGIQSIASKPLKALLQHMPTYLRDNDKCKSIPVQHHQLSKYEPFPLLHYQRSQKCYRLKKKRCHRSNKDKRSDMCSNKSGKRLNRWDEHGQSRNRSSKITKRLNRLKMTPG